MNYLAGLGIFTLIVAGSWWYTSNSNEITASSDLEGTKVTFYRSPSCGCCLGHAEALTAAGAEVTMEVVDEVTLQNIKAEHGIPISKQSCHTAIIDGYVVEGHVPIAALSELVTNKPDIKGITLPGMPIGTPGMPGKQTESFIVETLAGDAFWQKDPS